MIDNFENKLVSDYWTSKLRDRTPIRKEASFSACSAIISSDDLGYFNKLTGQSGMAEYTVLLAVYALLLSKYFPEFDGMVFSADDNPLLLSVYPEKSLTIRQFLQQIKGEVQEVYAHAGYDEETLQRKNIVDFASLSHFGLLYHTDIAAQLPFQLHVRKERGALYLELAYAERFAGSEMSQHFLRNFSSWIRQLEQYMDAAMIPLLDETERRTILLDFNDTARIYPEDKTMVDLFEAQVKRTPLATALVFEEKTWTYAALNAKANQLAHYLLDHYALAADDVIGVLLPKSDKAVIAILAILKTGAAYLPIDVHYPPERIDYIIKDSGIDVLIRDDIDTDRYATTDLLRVISPADLAYVIYTSGSTGHPKGVMVAHRSNVNMSMDQVRLFGVTEDDRIVWFASMAFDASVSEMMMALYSGAALIIPAEDVVKEHTAFGAFLQHTGATVVTFPPGYLDLLSDDDIGGLRCVITAGEAAHVQRAVAIAKFKDYYNAYGPTECAVCVSVYKVKPGDTVVPIGKPIANLSVYILDDHLHPVPVGVPGKLYVAGVGVARGYLGKPALTAEKFIPNIFGDGNMYDTGDTARWLPDGNIEYLGRSDEQVKIRGFRIEPGEIEHTLFRVAPVLQQVAVAVKKDVLVAYYVSASAVDKPRLREALQQILPEYMIPSFFVQLKAMPVTPNGKTDKKALPDVQEEDVIRKAYVAPENETEEKIVAIWQRILGIEQPGVMDNLFELGGNSLLITRVAAAIRKELQVDVPLKELFLHPTVRSLGDFISRQERQVYIPLIARRERPATIPLSFSQQRLWLVHQIEGSVHYHIPILLQLHGPVDRERLSAAFTRLVNRHEILRTVITEDGQVVLPEGQWRMSDHDGTIAAFIDLPFDLSQDHLLRVALFGDNVLAVVLHHIVADGWSMPIMAAELSELYMAGENAALLPLDIQYADYAIWQRSLLHSDFWENRARDMKVPELLTDLPRPAVKTINGTTLSFTVSRQLTSLLRELSGREDVTLFMTLLTIFKTLLYRYTGQEDLSIGTPVANRGQEEIGPLIGFFVNTLLLRNDLSGNPTFRELLTRVKETTLEAFTHQHIPCQAPLLNVLFVLQNNRQVTSLRIGDVAFSILPVEQKTSKFDLTFSVAETAEGLDIHIQYNTDLFLPDTIVRMKEHFTRLLTAVVSNVDTKIGQLPMLRPEDLFPGNRITYNDKLTLIDIFEAQVSDRVAIISENRALTYKEVDERSNQLAHYLQKQGIGRGDMVLLCLDEALELVLTGMLGILKSGAAYVPLDPDYPQERIDFIVRDTQARFAVSNRSCRTLSNSAVQVIALDENLDEPVTKVTTQLTPADLFYVIYTSGSTGQPKGVMITHGNITDYLHGLYTATDVSMNRSFGLMSTIATDLGNTVLLGALFTGATLHLFRKDTLRMPAALHAYFEQHPIDCIKIVPSYWKSLEIEGQFLLPRKMIIFGGEELPAAVLPRIPAVKVINHYGPTETTIGKLLFQVDASATYRVVPVGKAFSNTEIYIVDRSLSLCPVGVAGELLIGGDGVAKGYLNLPELTAEKFITNPFGTGRVYRTGDLVVRLADGNIVFKGRIDEQVKIRGYRIEPGEITAVLNQVVHQSVVIAKEDETGSRRLVAYVVPRGKFDKEVVSAYLKSKLPAYMVPSQLIEILALPVTSNGKIDKKALPEVAFTSEKYAGPRNASEEILVNIWKELLHIEQVGIYDNFFELGGDSIISIQLVSRANRQGLALHPSHVFEYQTIAGLAAHHLQQVYMASAAEQGLLTGESELLPIQRWLLETEFPHPSHYNQSQLLKIDKSISTSRIKQAIQALVTQHDALRFRYVRDNGQWRQYYGNAEVKVEVYEAGDITALCDAAQRSLDITTGKLLKVLLIKTPETDAYNRLFMVIHHLAVDGVSWRILLEQFEEWITTDTIRPGMKTSSFREWAAALKQQPVDGYWEGITAKYVALPVDKVTETVITAADRETYTVVLESTLLQTLLTAVNKAYNTEINDILVSALVKVLTDWSGKNAAYIGLEGHGRENILAEIDTSSTVGWFTTVYPLYLHIEQGLSSGDLISSVKEQLRAVPQKGLGFGLTGLKGKWDVVFNYLGQTDNIAKLLLPADEDKGADISPAFPFNRKLDVRGIIKDGRLEVDWTYSPLQYYPDTIAALADSFIQQLTQLILHCQAQDRVYTPADFGLAPEVNYKELSAFMAGKQISEVSRLSPLQKGMLFHHLYDANAKSYRQQLQVDFSGHVDVAAFEESWNYVLSRYSILRSSFVAHQFSIPVQCVHEHVSVPFEVLDMTAAEAADFIKADLERGFDFEVAPLMRIALIRLDYLSYKMVWTHHHIILDGWSNSVLLSAFKKAYAAFVNGVVPSAGETDRYADYIRYIAKTDQAAANHAWKEYLSGFGDKTLLPFTGKVPEHIRSKGDGAVDHHVFHIHTQQIRAYCQQHQLTVNTFVQGTWSFLLSRYAATPDIAFGVVVSGRPYDLANAEQRVGLYINNLPLRTMVDDQQDMVLWLQELQRSQHFVRQYQYTSLNDIQHLIGMTGELSDTVLVFENYPDMGDDAAILTIDKVAISEQTNYLLTITVVEEHDTLKIDLAYNSGLLSAADVNMIAGHFEHVIAQMPVVATPGAITLVTPAEATRLAVDFNATTVAYPTGKTVLDLFEEQVSLTPDSIALVYKDERLSFRQLDDAANRLAHYLGAKGVKRGALVGLCIDRSAAMLTGVLGILKAGAAYVPVDPEYPQERIAYILNDISAGIVVSNERYRHIISGVPLVSLDGDHEEILSQPATRPDRRGAELAYVIYTSGSTGNPKGVLVGHAALSDYIFSALANYTVAGNGTGSFIHLPLTFDAAITALYVPLLQGKRVVISAEKGTDIFRDPNFVQYAPYDFIKLTPAHMSVLKNTLDEDALKDLTYKYVLGGEALQLSDVQYWLDRHINVEIINEYGPTEATVGCSIFSFNTSVPVSFTEVPIGKPMANTSLYILDAAGHLLPVGVQGELYIGGAGLAEGYLNLPELTGEKFIHSDYGRLYKTGDLAKWLPDGNIAYLGRTDDQVKIRGYRIEPGEITAILNSCEHVAQGIVVVKDKRLIAYLVPVGTFEKERIQDYLQQHLPEYMLPSLLVELAEMPLTHNGKIDKRLLPDALPASAWLAPRNEVEARLASIWAELLRVERIGVLDDFFELGGDSIVSIQVVSKCQKVGLHVHPRDLFECRTIAALSARLATSNGQTAGEQGLLTGEAILLPIQRWFMELPYAHHSHYNQSQLLKISRSIPADAIVAAVKALVAQHDALRFCYHDGRQLYGQADGIVDIHTTGDIAALCDAAQRSLDITTGRLVKVLWIQTPADDSYNRLFLVIHHLVVDGVSWRILLEQLLHLLTGGALGTKTTSYRQWGQALQQHAATVVNQQSYWSGIIKAYTPLPIVHNGARKVHECRLDPSLTRQLLHGIHHAYSTDINDMLLAALAATLCSFARQSHIVIGMEGHGREYISRDIDLSSTVGWFTTMYPLLLTAEQDMPTGDLIRSIKEQVRAVPQKGIGYGLLRYLHPSAPIQDAKWDVVFNYLGQSDNVLTSDLLQRATGDTGESVGADFPFNTKLDISAIIRDEALYVKFSYACDTVTIEELSVTFTDHLRQLITHCQQTEKTELTPSDGGLSPEVNYKDLSAFLAGKNISEVYRLTALQKGMLFHYLYDNSTAYLEQFQLDFTAGVDVTAFTASWNYILASHSVLRSSFVADQFSIPVQCVHTQVQMPVDLMDYSGYSGEEQEAVLKAFFAADFQRGFDLHVPPLMRITLIKLDEAVYKMVWTRYHIVLDGWSNSVLIAEFLEAYAAFVKGSTPPEREEDKYSDYIRYIGHADPLAAQQFWKQYLHGFEDKSLLPFVGNIAEHSRNKGDGQVGHRFLKIADVEALRHFCQQHQLTINTLLQGVWSLLLSRYTGNKRVAFGVVVSGRPVDLYNVEQKVGLYINNLPLHSVVDGTVIDWLHTIQQEHTEAREYQYTALSEIQQWIGVKGDLFDTVFVFDNYPKARYDAEHHVLKVDGMRLTERRNYLLSLSVSLKEELVIDFSYNSDLLDDYYAEMISGHFEQALNQLIALPGSHVSDIDILMKGELSGFNDTTIPYPADKTIVDLFEEQVKRTPGQIALSFKDEQVTYSELNARADRLAHYLRTVYTLKADDLAGVMMDRSVWAIVSILGILKAGAAYVPIDINYPADRKSYIINDTALKVLIIESSSMLEVIDLDVSVLSVDIQYDDFEQLDNYNRDYVIQPDDLAYVIYTSGSTGRPKGVMIAHTSNVNMSLDQIRSFGITAGDRVLQFASYSFDASVSEIFMALYCGATLVLIEEAVIADGNKFLAYTRQQGVSVVTFPPVYLRTLDRHEFDFLRVIITAGEAAVPGDAIYYAGRGDYYNAYGPTECAVCVSIYKVDPQRVYKGQIPVGKPISNMKVFILDNDMNVLPVGVEGYLYVSGPGLARGYLHQPELTAEKFVIYKGERLYKTGDKAKWLPDGNLDFSGRADEQVKIRGYRIEPDEITSILNQVIQGVVVAKSDVNGNKRLIAYVVPVAGFDRDRVLQHLKQQLPEYMIPALVVELDSLPVTTNGKVDKKALPDPDAATLVTNEYEAPRNDTEERLVAIWQELLGVSRVGINDSFFELGGDSIICIQLVSRASRYGMVLHPQDVFEHQTIAALSARLNETTLIKVAEQGMLTGSAGLLPIQRWFLETDYPKRSHYNQSQLLSINKDVTAQQVTDIVTLLVNQHDALRFRYTESHDGWVQEYGDAPGVVEVHDSGDITALCNHAQRSLDIGTGKVIKVLLIKTPAHDPYNRLFLVIHHLVVDGVSWRILLEQFQEALKQPAFHPGTKTSSFREWVDAMNAYSKELVVTAQLPYWESVADRYVPLPVDKEATVLWADRYTHTVTLDRELTRLLLLDVNKTYNTEINDILLSALVQTIHEWTGHTAVVIGMEGHGREFISADLDTSRTVGWFTSVYPLLLETTGALSSGDLIMSVKEQLRQVPSKGIGYGLLRYSTALRARWDVVFNYLGQADNVLEGNAFLHPAKEHPGDNIGPDYPAATRLDINSVITDGVLTLYWGYADAEYEASTIPHISARFISHLTDLIRHCVKTEKQFTPADYGLSPEVKYHELPGFLAGKKISDIYRLSPLQKGMLFHHLYDSQGRAYMEQMRLELPEGLDIGAFEAAWNFIIRHHSILRSSFVADELSIPVQCVHEQVTLPLSILDYSDMPDQEAAVKQFLAADLERGFDFKVPPLMRITLIRLGDKAYRMVWTHYHIILDGWSNAVLISSFLQAYSAYARGRQPVTSVPDNYGDYIRYIAKTDHYAAELFWKEYMSGFNGKSLLPFAGNVAEIERNKGGKIAHQQLVMEGETAVAVKRYCQQHQLTVNTLVQGVWSLLLSKYTGNNDIAFGVVVSGRPADLSNAEQRIGLYINNLPLHTVVPADQPFAEWLLTIQQGHTRARQYQYTTLNEIQQWTGVKGDLFDTIVVFENYPKMDNGEDVLKVGALTVEEQTNYLLTLTAVEQPDLLRFDFAYNSDLLESCYAQMICGHFEQVLTQVLTNPQVSAIDILTSQERAQLLIDFNDTNITYDKRSTVVSLFEAQVARTPAATALVFEGATLSYAALNERANRLAAFLRKKGIHSGSLVGICIDRSIEMMVGLLGILKSGAAYIPVDPTYPVDRINYMLRDSNVSTLLVNRYTRQLIAEGTVPFMLSLDDAALLADEDAKNPETDLPATSLAYIIYTSGSTGRPKGVMISHRNVVNFFTGLDQRFAPADSPESWLAVTSISFDISVLELFWTLTKGNKVTILPDRPVPTTEVVNMDFSLFYFAAQEAISTGNKYELLLEGAKFADQHGLSAVWIPERHFHSFGDQFPNPSVAAAAVAVLTERIRIRSGSVVLPLHDPIRVAEEWAMVDNLSKGRVEMSVASGWHPNDFVFFPDAYKHRHQSMWDNLSQVQQLWKGEPLMRRNGVGNEYGVNIHPKPIQQDLPVWVTAAGSEETFRHAGAIGANVLTHLLGKTKDELKEKIAIYRASLAAHGFDPEKGKVALMLHTFVGDDSRQVEEIVKEPFKNYLRHSIDLLKPVVDQAGLSLENDLDTILEMGFKRYFNTSGLFGTPESCQQRVKELYAIGVNEIACLVDFGIDTKVTLAHLSHLQQLQQLVKQGAAQQALLARRMEKTWSPEQIILQQGITHMQCTPSFAKELVSTAGGQQALAQLQTLLIGGEALPQALTKEIFTYYTGSVYNMYGPTETTIWSTIRTINPADKVSIGTPIANTQVYVLGAHDELLPVGVAGELCIGGDGVSRGYLHKDALTAEKFVSLPFDNNGKIYRTGDLARWLPGGELECLGRLDDQVKISGHRIETGEIENVISELPAVIQCVVVKKEDSAGNRSLIGYIVPGDGFNLSEVQSFVRSRLPAYMVPALLLTLDKLPLTPNGKIDKKALPDPAFTEVAHSTYVAPRNDIETQLIRIWSSLLRIKTISVTDSFFELGGNSLMAIQIIAAVGQEMKVQISVRDLFEHPVVASLANLISQKEQHFLNRLVHAPAAGPYPLTGIQKAFWLASRQDSVSISYNTTIGWKVTGSVDLQRITAAFNSLLQRHEILRSVIRYDESGELSLFTTDVMDGLLTDITDLDPLTILEEENRFVFNFEQGPLMRIRILQNQAGEYFLLFNTHHIISDPFSLKMVFTDLLALYNGMTLPPVDFTFRDYAYSLSLQTGDHTQHEKFWRGYLEGRLPDVRFPVVKTYDAISNEAHIKVLSITDPHLLQQMRSYNREQQGTMFIMLLTLVKSLVHIETGQSDISFGSPVNGRDTADLKKIVGLMLNTVIIRTVIKGDATFTELYNTVKTSVLSTLSHNAYPYLDIAAIDTGKGEFNVGFNLNPTDLHTDSNAAGLSFTSLQSEERFVKADLWFDNTEQDDALTISLSYRKDRFEDAYIKTLVDKLGLLLKYCMTDNTITLPALKAKIQSDRIDTVKNNNLKKLKHPHK
jgi:natural product biosynthesis luciferase-like monooxygenase protein/amino acid adenylation domain-containing protein/non-ribosomal peptide synthase protein (TIGR01720 family)